MVAERRDRRLTDVMRSARKDAIRRLANADSPGAEVVEPDPLAVALPVDLLDDDEVILYAGRSSPLYIVLSCATWLIACACIAFFLAWLARYVPSVVGWSDTQAIVLGLVLAMLRLGWQTLDWYGRVHVLTDRRLLTRTGVLRMNVFQTQLRKLQHTTIFCRVRERMFGLGTIAFATAGSDAFETFWVMVARPVEVHRKVLDAINRYGGGMRNGRQGAA